MPINQTSSGAAMDLTMNAGKMASSRLMRTKPSAWPKYGAFDANRTGVQAHQKIRSAPRKAASKPIITSTQCPYRQRLGTLPSFKLLGVPALRLDGAVEHADGQRNLVAATLGFALEEVLFSPKKKKKRDRK